MREYALAILHTKNKKIVLQLRDNIPTISAPNQWSLFGGAIEQGETPLQAVVREVKEELDIDLPIQRVHLIDVFYLKPEEAWHVFHYQLNDELQHATILEGQAFGEHTIEALRTGSIDGIIVRPLHLTAIDYFWKYHLLTDKLSAL